MTRTSKRRARHFIDAADIAKKGLNSLQRVHLADVDEGRDPVGGRECRTQTTSNKALALDWIACGDGSDWPAARGCLPILL